MSNISLRVGCLFVAVCAIACLPFAAYAQTPHFAVSFPAERSAQPIDGRLLLLLSTDPSAEPRMQIDDTPKSQIIFGTDVEGMGPGASVTIPPDAAGYPIRNLR